MEPHENHEAKLMSIPIAMMMAVVATLGAVVAYRAALAEHETVRSERRLQQGKMLEFVHRQDTLNKIANRTRYEYAQYIHLTEANSDLKQAEQLVSTDRRRAASLTLQAQEHHIAARVLRPYLNFFWVDLSRPLEESLEQDAARQLSGYGFDALWVEPAKKNEPPQSIWKDAESYVVNERGKVVRLAGAVLLFVLALAFFTFAQLSLKSPTRKNLFAAAAILTTLVGLTVTVLADHSSWKALLLFLLIFVALVLFGLLVPLGQRLWHKLRFMPSHEAGSIHTSEVDPKLLAGIQVPRAADEEEAEPIHPSELDPALFAGMRVHLAPVAHSFGRFIIFMIAVTAVLSALSGLLYSKATSRSATAFSEALEDQGTLFKTNSSSGASFFNMVGDMSIAQEYHLRYEAAKQQADLARENPSLLDVNEAVARMDHWKLLLGGLGAYNKGLDTKFKSELGPDRDRNFPGRMVNQGRKESERAFALADAHNELSLGWQEKATTYLAMLTFFAIALYLFGQALSMGRTRDAALLVVFSCGLVVYSIGYGTYMSLEKKHAVQRCEKEERPGEDLAHDAARHYAEGRILFEGASDDPRDLAKAAKEFGCAVGARPEFAMGNLYYALSTQLSESPQLNESGFVSITSQKSVKSITEHEGQVLKKIKEQGLKAPVTPQVNYGFDSVVQGLLEGDRKIVERGIAETKKAIALEPGDLIPQFNLALGFLADGQKEEGLIAYKEAINHSREQGEVVAGAVTDLDILRRYCSVNKKATDCQDIERRIIPQLKSEMVAAAWPPKAPSQPTSPAKISGIQLAVTASGFRWKAPKPDIDKDRDVLAVLWFAYNPEWETWRVLPLPSGRSDWKLDDQGMASDFRPVLTTRGRTCVPDSTYRAELYVNGEIAGSQDITTQHGNFQSVAFPAVNLAICYPDSWKGWESGDQQASPFVKGYVGDAGARGGFLFTYFNPRQQPDDAMKEHYLNEAVSFLANHNLTARLPSVRPINNCAGQPAYPGEMLTAFTDGSAWAAARVGMEQDGLVHVAVVFDNTGTELSCDTLMSTRYMFTNAY